MTNEICGILVVDKPEGWTSHDVVSKTKNMLRARKTGHTGTLDPMATGVLVLLLGKATKSAPMFENDSKRYRAEISFGFSTDTYDRTGTVSLTGDPGTVDLEKLQDLIDNFKGMREQIPPMYSAVKVNGRKLYELARKGKVVERKPRIITIESIAADLSGFPVINVDVHCSKGTYLRSIAHEIGEMAGCPAHLSGLVRTASGRFTLDNAVDFSAVVESGNTTELLENIIPIDIRN